jgi:hypothetical protein
MTHRHLITDPATAKTFITAGKAFFTLANTTTDNHATYRVEAVKGEEGEEGVLEVALFVGTDNSERSSYTPIGRIENGVYSCTLRDEVDVARDVLAHAEKNNDSWLEGFCKNIIGRLSAGNELTDRQAQTLERNRRAACALPANPLAPTAPKVKGFGWIFRRVEDPAELASHVQFWTEGRCCTCGRRLTNPVSIEDLEGPVCRKNRGVVLTGTVLLLPEHEDA